MKRFLLRMLKIIAVLLFVIFVCLGVLYINQSTKTGVKASAIGIFKSENSNFLVFAHRGGGGVVPENTLEAFKHSADLGVDVLELDVHATKDGKLVVMHDSTVDRTTNGSGKISEMTLAEVKKLDAGYKFSNDNGQSFPFRDKGIVIPTLDEIFTAFPDKKFNIEPKQAEPSIIKPLCNLLREKSLTEKIIIGSFKQEVIDEFRAICPEVATSASPSEVTEFLALEKVGLSETYSPPMQALQVPLNIVDENFVEKAHRLNLKVHVWTVNQTEDMKRLIDLKVDGIMTDYPEKLLDLLPNRKNK